jgi:Na+/H+ antiporter NhaA
VKLPDTFRRFQDSEAAGGYLLIGCTVLALILANSPAAPGYAAFWRAKLGGLSLAQWVNDALMAVFFLMIGLELERELYGLRGRLRGHGRPRRDCHHRRRLYERALPLLSRRGARRVRAARSR